MARIVHPSRRMQRAHPYDVWKVLSTLRILDRLSGRPDDKIFYDRHDIARYMFSNWDALDDLERERVIRLKLIAPLMCLRINHRIEEEQVQVDDRYHPGYHKIRGTGRFQARPALFNVAQFKHLSDYAYMLTDMERDHNDDKWMEFLGKKERKI